MTNREPDECMEALIRFSRVGRAGAGDPHLFDRSSPWARVNAIQPEELNMIERISSLSTIFMIVLAVVVTTLAIFVLLRPVTASERPAGDVVTATESQQQGFQTQARASAKASASAVSKSGAQGCRAESSTQAEARAGDDHDYQEDHDRSEESDGGCRAESAARAKAGSNAGAHDRTPSAD